ncbi:MAG: porphobilinogen synthase [Ferrimicrobium sp.]
MDVNSFPRPRRLRSSTPIRQLVAETSLAPSQLICPIFVRQGALEPKPIVSMPGVVQHSLDSLERYVALLGDRGVSSILLFGVTDEKDDDGSLACRSDFVLQVAIDRIKQRFGHDVSVFSDLCLDEYTTHGHCGVLRSDGTVDNDATLERYQELALSLGRAGVDFVAPSGMMDHQVAAIRSALDANSLTDVGILAYSAKYASALYGPFRDAVEVTIADGGNRAAYQQDYRNSREALLEVDLDIAEGADIVMVKPAGFYLDVIAAVAARATVPVAAYQVSGEYAMIVAAGEAGYIDADAAALESLIAIRRAGAQVVITYFADRVAQWQGRMESNHVRE